MSEKLIEAVFDKAASLLIRAKTPEHRPLQNLPSQVESRQMSPPPADQHKAPLTLDRFFEEVSKALQAYQRQAPGQQKNLLRRGAVRG